MMLLSVWDDHNSGNEAVLNHKIKIAEWMAVGSHSANWIHVKIFTALYKTNFVLFNRDFLNNSQWIKKIGLPIMAKVLPLWGTGKFRGIN